ncbi:winged helix-turn-helix domain-containing protein [Streptomyces sp. NPDC059582]|uniref:winged helix-turn-helix domain-containing protein n=1 Tax=Streptomyces sp. NPDC059582 TaxID=3346875 RepID=UPI0036976D3E
MITQEARTRSEVFGEVQLLRWPAQRDLREECRSRGTPRILVVEAGLEAPVCDDIYEDWVRTPVTSPDLKARTDALVHRYRRNRAPQLDEDGVLRFASRSVTLSPMQAALLALLVAQFAQVVPREALRSRLGHGQGSMSRNALDLHMMRIRHRINALGLTIRTVWGRGYVLDAEAAAATS